jgi:hypothetical protein
MVHEDAARFFIVPGHPRLDGESVIHRLDRYEVVRKAAATTEP